MDAFRRISRRCKAAGLFLLLLASRTPSHGAVIQWLASGTTSAWTSGSNWAGGTSPANDLTTDTAAFDQAGYAFQPNAGTASVNGLQVGDGSTATAPLFLSGAALSLGSGGLTMAANAGPVTISTSVTLGAAQTWSNNSTALLTVLGTVGTGSNVLTVAGSGSSVLTLATGTAGVTMSGSGGMLTMNSTMNTAGQLLKVTSGTAYLKSARNMAANIEVDGGTLLFNGADRYSPGTNHQTLLVTGGQVSLVQNGGYGIRLNGDSGSGSGGGTGVAFTAAQTGGTVTVSGGGNGNFDMGSSSANDTTTYSLSGTGVLNIANGSGWSLGADTAGTSTTVFYLSGGKLLAASGMSGAQGAGARQAFVWTGGTLAASSYTAANLTSGTGIAVSSTSATLTNAGGTLAPGDVGTPGKMTIAGNYAVTSTNAVLSVGIGGTTQAAVFQDVPARYDTVAVTGKVSLNGTLAVYLGTGYAPAPASTFSILSGAALTGSFQNIAFGGRMTTADGLGSFVVNQSGNAVVLSDFIWLGNAPQITTQPQPATVIAGKTATFSVTAAGLLPFTYQWYEGGTPVATGTLPWLSIGGSGTSSAGAYSVVIGNSYGSVTSGTVALSVNPGTTGTAGMLYPLNQTPVYGAGGIVDSLGATQGTLVNTPPPTLVPGPAVSGSAWKFSGLQSYVSVAANSFTNRLGDINQSTGLTVGMWLNVLYEKNSGMDNSRAVGLGGGDAICDITTSNGGGSFEFNFGNGASVSSGSVMNGQWRHVVASYDFQKSSNNLVLYVDGKAASTTTAAAARSFSNSNSSITIGGRNGSNGGFVGSLGQMFVYDRALTANEVSSIYATGTVANQAPAVVAGVAANQLQWPAKSTTVSAAVTDDGLPNPPGTVTGSWSTVSKPAGQSVILNGSNALNCAVTLSGTGAYILRYTASDSQLTNYGDVTINVTANQAPVIDSCTVSPVLLASSTAGAVTLNAAATDDGLPNPPAALTTLWSQLSGPASVAVAYPGSLSTTAAVPAVDGTYVMQFSANDGAITSSTNVSFVVDDYLPPTVTASAAAQTLSWPANSTTLNAAVSNRGPNPPGATTVTWRQLSGPATAALSATSALNCPVTLPAEGQYVFQATAFDGVQTASATTWINVWSPGRPIVMPGSVRTLWLPAACTLSGSLAAVSGSSVPVQWSVVQGPGTVTFGTPNALNTTASFSAAGEYWLQLSATDGIYSNAGRVPVEVYDSSVSPGQYGGGNFGYTGSNASLRANFTGDLQLPYSFSGLDWNRLKPPPPPYVHPRIYFNPDDLPDLRSRLTTSTTQGPALLNTITTTVANALTSQGAAYNQVYNDLASGIPASFAAQGSNRTWIVCLISYEAFRCLIDNDATGGAKAGAALATVATYTYPILQADNSNDWQGVVFPAIYQEWMGYGYDFAYNFMTPAQQASVRQLLTLATTNAQGLGISALPAFHTNTSNWNQWNGFYLVTDALAVEGEAGYDASILPRIQGNFQRMWALDIFPEGSLFEGMGKGALFADSLIALGKRGIMIPAVTGALKHVQQFYAACMETTGYAFTWEEWAAGNGLYGNNDSAKHADVPVIKFLFPNDPVVDFIHRNAFGTANYLTSSVVTSISSDPGDEADLLGRTICALDFDTSLTWSQAVAQQVAPNLPLTQLFNNHGLLVTRTDWTGSGMRLMFQPRTEPGGHSERDRDVFMLSALGRIWLPYGSPEPGSYDYSIDSSVPRIDGTGPSVIAAKFVDFLDTPSFTYGAGDAAVPYSWTETTSPGLLEGWNYNQNLLTQSPQPWANLPWGLLPNWDTSVYSPLYWAPNTPVQRAFRTAAMVRGTNSYVIVADDLQKDANTHSYTDRMILAGDLTNIAMSGSDAVVTSSTNSSVSMLVRVLRCSGSAAFSHAFNADNYNCLDVNTSAVAPDYVLMLYPFTAGTALPATSWVGNVVYVTWPNGQVDHIGFTPNADGRTRLAFAQPGADTTPPVLTVPANIVTTATAAQGNVENFVVTGSDAVDGAVPVACAPPSGSVFPIGTTTVLCTATDSSLNSAQASFTVTVQQGAFALTAPTGVTAAAGEGSAAISWNAVPPAAGYNIYRSLTSGSGFSLIAGGVTGTSYADSGLTDGTPYYYFVSAFNGAGTGPASSTVNVVPVPVPAPWTDGDIGSVGLAGSSTIAASGATWMSAAGSGIGGGSDSFHFVSQPRSGNCTVVAEFLGFTNASNSSAAGVMLRKSLASNAANAFMGAQNYASQYYFSYRATSGAGTATTSGPHSAMPQWFKLVLSGSTVTGYDSGAAPAGQQAWVQVGSPSPVALPASYYAGLALVSSATNTVVTGSFNAFAIYSPPVLNPPADEVLEATGSYGAVAVFAVTGSSNVDGTLAAVCAPATGSVFPLGATPVSATVSDSAGDVVSGSFNVTVRDTTPPVVTVPANINVVATTGSGASQGTYVTFSASAVDLVSGSVPAASVPASGSFFTVGTSTVVTSATDAAGNAAAQSFTVTVQPIPPPVITTVLGSQTVASGQPATFSISATGSGPFTYQWLKNGAPIPGATTSSYTIPSTAAGDAATYAAQVTDAHGDTSSSTCTLNVSSGVPALPLWARLVLPLLLLAAGSRCLARRRGAA